MPTTTTPTTTLVRRTVASLVLLGATTGAAFGLAAWKNGNLAAAAAAAAAHQTEPTETVEAGEAHTHPFARSTTAIGTARALQSITLRNELPGTVSTVAMRTGQVVEAGGVLVELDVAVEQAELSALEAEARLAESLLARIEQAMKNQGASAADVDRARAERDKALANVLRTKALIERKRLHAPFRARVGMVDLHKGQYLEAGTTLTTLQGVDDAVHVDFAVTQEAAAALQVGGKVQVLVGGRSEAAQAEIVAIDARVEAATRSTSIRALLRGTPLPQPGASVRVQVPIESVRDVLVVPVNSLQRGPAGDMVFVLATTPDGKTRAHMRRVVSGPTLGDFVVVREGLVAGDRVASTGSFKLREGVLVNVVDTTNQPQAK